MTKETYEKASAVMIKLEHHNEVIRRFENEWLYLSKETLIRYLSDEEKEPFFFGEGLALARLDYRKKFTNHEYRHFCGCRFYKLAVFFFVRTVPKSKAPIDTLLHFYF